MVRYVLSGLILVATVFAAVAQFAPRETRYTFQLDDRVRESMEKVRRGDPLHEDDLASYGCFDLALLRNAVYARHGRPFKKPEFREHFSREQWYRPNQAYTDAMLTFDDRANIRRLQGAESSCPGGRPPRG